MARLKAKSPKSQKPFLVDPNFLRVLRENFKRKPQYRLIQNAVTQVSVHSIANQRDIVTQSEPTFSVTLDTWEVTDQKRSGRCWMFAGLNLLRAGAIKKMGLRNFEFSQNYLLFWDKFEKANFFFQGMVETADRGEDDRTVAFLLAHPLEDGGQWTMFVNLVRKYGLVPKSVMPESESSSNTPVMNSVLTAKVREGAKILREASRRGTGSDRVEHLKKRLLAEVYRILAIHLGNPPEVFDWQWRETKNKKLHREMRINPLRFAAKYADLPLEDYVCLVHDPRRTSPFYKMFTVAHLGNMVGGDPVLYLNVEMPLMKRLAMKSLVGGEPVWFGCDVGKQMDRALGLWDFQLRDLGSIYDSRFTLDKQDRLIYGESKMTHAMLFTGVDIVGGKPRRWRVENSWGDKGAHKGFYTMNDSWFDEYMFEIAVRKDLLPKRLQRVLAEPPIVLPPWDPMGSLA